MISDLKLIYIRISIIYGRLYNIQVTLLNRIGFNCDIFFLTKSIFFSRKYFGLMIFHLIILNMIYFWKMEFFTE